VSAAHIADARYEDVEKNWRDRATHNDTGVTLEDLFRSKIQKVHYLPAFAAGY
jgi:hypothetical protein